MDRALVICADDFGMNAAVSRGIIALAQRGRLSATSVMVLAPEWPTHAPALAQLRGRLDVGLHLDWTSPWALAAGHGMPLGRLMLRSSWRQPDAVQVQREIERQLDLFEAHWHGAPDHVDGHQHVQQFPVIRDALVRVLAHRYPQGRRPWLRISDPLAPGLDLKARAIGLMGARALQQLAAQAHIPHTRHLCGIYGFEPDAAAYGRRLQGWLAQASRHDGVVLMCHPASPGSGAHDPADPIAPARAQEYALLQGELLPQCLQAQGLRLGRGSDVATAQ